MQDSNREIPVAGVHTQVEILDKPALTEVPASVNKLESSRRHPQKPSGRARRLQPPIFKERIERILSKLKIREVKDELDAIENDATRHDIVRAIQNLKR